jgi:hypothetical protein
LDRAEEIFCWLRDTDKRFKREECGGDRLEVESVSFAGGEIRIKPYSFDWDPDDIFFPIQYLWMPNEQITAQIEASRAEKDALREAAKIAEEKAIAALKQRAKEDRKRDKEAKERKRLRALAAKYPDEVGP